jgi:hypothetical protein
LPPPPSQQPNEPQTSIIEIGHIGAVPVSIIILPPRSRMDAPAPLLARTLDIIGIGNDVAEASSAIFMVPALPDTMAFLDIAVEFAATLSSGDTFVGRPHESAPMMAVVGQDVWWTAFEAAGVFVAKEGLIAGGIATGELPVALTAYLAGNVIDAGTSATSAVYDIGRLTGAIPNVVSFGIYFDESSGTRI